MKKILIFLLISISVAYFGRVDKEILDELEVATAIGYDFKGKQKIEVTAVMPRINPDKSIVNKTISTIASVSKEALRELNQKSHKPIVSGKLEVAVYNKKIAKIGIQDYIDTFHRDPSVGSRLQLVIVDGNAKKMLKKSFGEFETGGYIQRLLLHNMEQGILPTSNLHTFLTEYYAKGMDPVLPLIELQGDNIKIKGLALFKGTKMVKELSQEKLFVFKALQQKLKLAGLKIKTKEDNKTEYFSIQGISSKKEFQIKNIHSNPEIFIHLKVKGFIREYTGNEVTNKTMKKAEELMKKKIRKQSLSMIKSFQKANIDPLGLGEQARSRTRNWDEKMWEQQYKNCKIHVKVDVLISEIGVVDGVS